MKGPSGAGIADILKTIREQAPAAPQQISIPPPATAEPKKSAMRKAGSTGKNSVVIKL
jgi:hypothetical protein